MLFSVDSETHILYRLNIGYLRNDRHYVNLYKKACDTSKLILQIGNNKHILLHPYFCSSITATGLIVIIGDMYPNTNLWM